VRIRSQADADPDLDIGRGILRREPTIAWRPAQRFIAYMLAERENLARPLCQNWNWSYASVIAAHRTRLPPGAGFGIPQGRKMPFTIILALASMMG